MRSTAHCKLDGLPAEILSLLPGKTVYCSFSGGADSLALLLFLKEWSRRISFSLEAVHFEHGFRGADSLADARFCHAICEREKIPFQLFRINVPKHRLKGEGDEEAARRMRLDYWHKIVRNPGNSLIAVGHHADDRIENVLLRLFRGSNASGLSSMRAVQKLVVKDVADFAANRISATKNCVARGCGTVVGYVDTPEEEESLRLAADENGE